MRSKKLIIGNWKSNPESSKLAKEIFIGSKKFAKKNKNTEVVVCPPIIFIESLKKYLSGGGISLGVQDIFWEASGSFTGKIGYDLILDAKVKYTIVGHSEMRKLGETNEEIKKKISISLACGITPVICIGENNRDANLKYLDQAKDQLVEIFSVIPKNKVSKIVIAYEPIWAIGKDAKREPHPREIEEMIIFIKRVVGDIYRTKSVPPIKIIYGGSVTPGNTQHILEEAGVDGLLVGRASLNQKTFGEIIDIANKIK